MKVSAFKAFDAAVFGVSRFATRAKLDAWLQAVKGAPSSSESSGGGEVLAAHGGPKSLLPFQEDVVSSLETARDHRRHLVALPTGAGKTFTAVQWLLRRLRHGGAEVVWVAPQRLLLEQAEEELRSAWHVEARPYDLLLTSPAGASCQGSSNACRRLRFVTYQSLVRSRESRQADIVVADEAHHTEGNEFGAALDRLTGRNTQLVGLSATPGRRDSAEFKILVERFGGRLIVPKSLGDSPVRRLRELEVYAHLRNVHLDDTDNWRIRKGPESQALSVARLDAMVESCSSMGTDARVLIFCYSLAHCHVVASVLHAEGLPVAVVGSELGRGHNRAVVEAFRSGEVRFVVNVKYLAVGADFPFANAAILSVPLESAIQFEQVVGRIARGPAVGGTSEATLIDFDHHLDRHEAIQSYARFWQGWWGGIVSS